MHGLWTLVPPEVQDTAAALLAAADEPDLAAEHLAALSAAAPGAWRGNWRARELLAAPATHTDAAQAAGVTDRLVHGLWTLVPEEKTRVDESTARLYRQLHMDIQFS